MSETHGNEKPWVILNHDSGMWWRANGSGYVSYLGLAGRYSPEGAKARGLDERGHPDGRFDEPMPLSEARHRLKQKGQSDPIQNAIDAAYDEGIERMQTLMRNRAIRERTHAHTTSAAALTTTAEQGEMCKIDRDRGPADEVEDETTPTMGAS